MQKECDLCIQQGIEPAHGCLRSSIQMIMCEHKQQTLAEHGVFLSQEELEDNISTMKLLERIMMAKNYGTRQS